MKHFVGRMLRALLLSIAGLALVQSATAAGRIKGAARFERIKGRPSMGYVELYETSLFLSPASTQIVGPARRLGTTYEQNGVCITNTVGDGRYCIEGLPPGTYSTMVNRSLFFVAPKVVPNVLLPDNTTITVNPELPIDYSTYFLNANQWTAPEPTWYQTFTATGTAVRGVSIVLAGATPIDTSANVSVLRDNGDPDVRNWQVLGTRTVGRLPVGGDLWVRWRSGEIPMIPGTRYAVRVSSAGGTIQPYKRNKDYNSYVGGQAYDTAGVAQSFDLNFTVFTDNDGTRVTMNKRSPEIGQLCEGNFAIKWAQSFTAEGWSLAAADVWAAGAAKKWDLDFAWRVRLGGPAGPQIGPTKVTAATSHVTGSGLHGVSYNPEEIPLVPGQTYCIEFEVSNPPPESNGFNPYLMTKPPGCPDTGGGQDSYAGGMAYRWNGASWDTLANDDVNMTIIEYQQPSPAIELTPSYFSRKAVLGTALSEDVFTVRNSASGTLNYAVSENTGWLSVSPSDGSSTGQTNPITVSYAVSALPIGTYQAVITVSDPQALNNPQVVTVSLRITPIPGDFDLDGDVDQADFGVFQNCLAGTGVLTLEPGCADADLDEDEDVDQSDLGIFQGCISGPDTPADPDCGGSGN